MGKHYSGREYAPVVLRNAFSPGTDLLYKRVFRRYLLDQEKIRRYVAAQTYVLWDVAFHLPPTPWTY